MKILKKILATFFLTGMLFGFSSIAFAESQSAIDYDRGDQAGTALPYTPYGEISDCEKIMLYTNMHVDEIRKLIATRGALNSASSKVGVIGSEDTGNTILANDILACGIKTGDIKLWMVPFYIRFALEFLLGVAGLLSVAALIFGGYLYLFAGITEDKEKGKKAIQNALIGLVVALCSWAIVNIVIGFVSG